MSFWRNYYIYFEVYDFFISMVWKLKWKAYVQIAIIKDKIQIYKMVV